MASNERKNARVASGRVDTNGAGSIAAGGDDFSMSSTIVGIADITLVQACDPARRVVTHSTSLSGYVTKEDQGAATPTAIRLYLQSMTPPGFLIDAEGLISFEVTRVGPVAGNP